MCGIAGFFNREVRDASLVLRRMCDQIRHRGLDEDGYHVQDGLGSRGLSIIDLGGGRQPMANEDGSRWIVFNGGIYNYRELRSRLIQGDHRLSTHSDTEVILHQYEEDGPRCVEKLNGMFAVAIWDRCERSLFLARDRLTIKPLYYY